jgi:catechol 2,3-dioxygenase-like lactoylglutathione lyase family enzyme
VRCWRARLAETGRPAVLHSFPLLGRFLEISVHAPAIRESLAFYESLGFVQAAVGEAWPHPYAVVTDGRACIGLHAGQLPLPALTFVLPDLAHALHRLRQQGVAIEQERIGDEVFNQAWFRDPTGHQVTVVEARTFSPLTLDPSHAGSCGYFTEYGMPARDARSSCQFWEPLGFVAMDEQAEPFPRTSLTSELLNIGLYRSRALRQPVLTFEDSDMRERLSRLRERGFELSDAMPDSLDEHCNAVLIAPEGTQLLLLQSPE